MPKARHYELLGIIKDQAPSSGVVKVSDDILAILLGVSVSTVKRDIIKLEEEELLFRDSVAKRAPDGSIKQIRYFVITDKKFNKTGYGPKQNMNLAHRHNHKIVMYRDKWGHICGYECFCRPNGIGTEWILNFPGKDFKTVDKCNEYIDSARYYHKKFLSKNRDKIDNLFDFDI